MSKTEVISDKKFIEYTKEGYPTYFTITLVEPYRRWEFDMENSNMTGHWTGIFTAKGDETEIDFYGTSGSEEMAAEAFCEIVFEKAADTVRCGYNEKFFIKTYI